MNVSKIKLTGALAMSMAMAGAGPVWSATPDLKAVVSKAKPVVKAKKAPAKTVKAQTAAKSVKAKKAPVVTTLAAVPAVAATEAVAPLIAVAPSAAAEQKPAAKPVEATPAPAPVPPYMGNPYLAYRQQAGSPAVVVKSAVAANAPAPAALGNPYLSMAYPQQASMPVAAVKPAEAAAAAPVDSGNPYLDLAYRQPAGTVAAAPPNTKDDTAGLLDGIKTLLPSIPDGKTFLPSIKTVYPTGEKPLVVLSFNCPTEMIGITPIPTKLLKEGLEGVFGMINATDLLSFDLMQVCQ